MVDISKGRSPFYPGQPVPVDLFAGRAKEIDHILNRGAVQVAAGKPMAFFIQGEYGIGKSSIAQFTQRAAEQRHSLHGIYATLGGCREIPDVAARVLEATIKSGAFFPTRMEKVRNWLADYISGQELFGVSLNLEALRRDAPKSVATPQGLLSFFAEAIRRLEDTGVRGIFLVLDEINGITGNPQFAHFLKGLVDSNAMAREPVPLLLMLCGVREKRGELIQCHQPIGRVFDVIDIAPMSNEEMRLFFTRAFSSVDMRVEEEAWRTLLHWSAGLPKIMHEVGDAAFWLDEDGEISVEDASRAVVEATEAVGKKYIDEQVYDALRSRDYKSILGKIGKRMNSASQFDGFTKREVERDLTENEKQKFNNFIQRLKKLHAIRSGDNRGEYRFTQPMIGFYIWYRSMK